MIGHIGDIGHTESWEALAVRKDNCFSVIMLQLPDLALVAVNFPLQTFNLFLVVLNLLLVMLLQCSQLLLLLTPGLKQIHKGK